MWGDFDYNRLQVYVQENFNFGSLEVWIREQGITTDFNYHLENGKIIKQEYPKFEVPSDNLKPFLKMPLAFGRFFADMVLLELQSKGVRTETQNFTIGKLEATEKHLSDMREMTNKLLNHVTNDKP